MSGGEFSAGGRGVLDELVPPHIDVQRDARTARSPDGVLSNAPKTVPTDAAGAGRRQPFRGERVHPDAVNKKQPTTCGLLVGLFYRWTRASGCPCDGCRRQTTSAPMPRCSVFDRRYSNGCSRFLEFIVDLMASSEATRRVPQRERAKS